MSLAKTYSFGPIDAGQIRGHMMPMKHNNTRLAHGRILLVGDAAGVIDPFSGEGIFYGVKSSLLALPVILNFLEKKSADMTEYDEAVKREITPELRTAWVIQKLNSVSPRLFFHYLEESDRVWRAFCGMLRGERTYVQLKNRLSLPLRLGFEIL
jgi:flavin-dependent dehydrogenase